MIDILHRILILMFSIKTSCATALIVLASVLATVAVVSVAGVVVEDAGRKIWRLLHQ
jgi:hypothetical protein